MSTIAQCTDSIKWALAAGLVPFISGPPGIGKSAIVRMIRDNIYPDHIWIDRRAAGMDPVETGGPLTLDGIRLRPDWMPVKPSFVFLDEFNQAPTATQNVFFQFLRERCIGSHELAPGSQIVLAGNRHQDRAIVNAMSSAANGRLVFIDLDPDLDGWLLWANNVIHPMDLAFLAFRPDLFYTFRPELNPRSYCCNRSHEHLSKLLYVNPPQDVLFNLTPGIIGQGEATEFNCFTKIYQSLPDKALILKDPTTAPLPDLKTTHGLSIGFALCGALMPHAKTHPEEIIRYGMRMQAEIAIMYTTTLIKHNPQCVLTGAFQKEFAPKYEAIVKAK